MFGCIKQNIFPLITSANNDVFLCATTAAEQATDQLDDDANQQDDDQCKQNGKNDIHGSWLLESLREIVPVVAFKKNENCLYCLNVLILFNIISIPK